MIVVRVPVDLRDLPLTGLDKVLMSTHPRLHGDVVEAAIYSARQGGSCHLRSRLVITTLSEGAILRIQRMVRERKLSHENVVFVVDERPFGSGLNRKTFDEQGRFLQDWRGGFFNYRLRELF